MLYLYVQHVSVKQEPPNTASNCKFLCNQLCNFLCCTAHPDNYNLLNPIPAAVQAVTFTCYTSLNGRNSTWKACITKVVFSEHHENFQFYSNSDFFSLCLQYQPYPCIFYILSLKMAFSSVSTKTSTKELRAKYDHFQHPPIWEKRSRLRRA